MDFNSARYSLLLRLLYIQNYDNIITSSVQLYINNCAMLFLNHIIKYFYQLYNFIPKGIIKQKRLMSNNIRQEINEKPVFSKLI